MLVNCPPHDPWTDQEQMKCCSCRLSTPSTDREQPILQSCELIAEDGTRVCTHWGRESRCALTVTPASHGPLQSTKKMPS